MRERWLAREGAREGGVEEEEGRGWGGATKRRKAGETRKVAAEAVEGIERAASKVEEEEEEEGEQEGLVGAGGRRGKRTLRCVIASGASAHRRGID